MYSNFNIIKYFTINLFIINIKREYYLSVFFNFVEDIYL